MERWLVTAAIWVLVVQGAVAASGALYDEALARGVLWYASAAYVRDSQSLLQWRCVACKHVPMFRLDGVFADESTGALALVGFAPELNAYVLSFRGTVYRSTGAIFSDLQYFETQYPPDVPCSGVHEGFLNYFRAVNDSISNLLASLKSDGPERPLIITGHSLGGAAAVLAAHEYSSTFNVTVYTFGTPRVGNQCWATHLSSLVPTSYRIVHNGDPVVRLPPCSWNLFMPGCAPAEDGYPRHTPTEVWYDTGMTTYRVCSPVDGEDPTCDASASLDGISIHSHRYYFGVHVGGDDEAEQRPETIIQELTPEVSR